jgi:CBS domain-containing protein
MSIGRICQRQVATVEAQETIGSAARRMKELSVGSLVVVSRAHEPVGVLTDRDIVTRVIAEGTDPGEVHVRSVMTRPLKTVLEQASVDAALTLMSSGGFRRLIVVDHEGKLVGIVSLDDILSVLSSELKRVSELLKKESPRIATRA